MLYHFIFLFGVLLSP